MYEEDTLNLGCRAPSFRLQGSSSVYERRRGVHDEPDFLTSIDAFTMLRLVLALVTAVSVIGAPPPPPAPAGCPAGAVGVGESQICPASAWKLWSWAVSMLIRGFIQRDRVRELA
jgi:hypothetical protein